MYELDTRFEIEIISNKLSEILEKEENYARALNFYKIGYQISKDKFGKLLKIGRCFQKLGQIDNAFKSYSQAIYVNPKSCESYLRLGWL